MEIRSLRAQINRERAGRKRPRRYSAALRSSVVAQLQRHKSSGGHVTTLSSALGLSRHTILAWAKRGGVQASVPFIPVTVREPRFEATLLLPGGYELRGDAASVAAVVRELTS